MSRGVSLRKMRRPRYAERMTEARTPTSHPVLAVLRRMPATLTMVSVILVVGVVWQGLWSPFEKTDLFGTVAYGLPLSLIHI